MLVPGRAFGLGFRLVNADFDGDGRSDVSVFRPSTGEWLIYGSESGTVTVFQFGLGTDILTPGDYDGDGRTDFAVFRPSESNWYVHTRDGYFVRNFGLPGDIPAPADYDGDGRTDFAVFRPSSGQWFITDNVNSYQVVRFGIKGDVPVRGDYDRDRRDDIAVWRPRTGFWYVLGSSRGFFGGQLGMLGDKPVQLDYDHDGKTDFAAMRGSQLFYTGSSSGFKVVNFPALEGRAITPGDYDGDGLDDVGLFHSPSGGWSVFTSGNVYIERHLGTAGDKAVAAAYLAQ